MDTYSLAAIAAASTILGMVLTYYAIRVAKFAMSSRRRFCVCLLVGTLCTMLVVAGTMWTTVLVRFVKAWLMNVGHSCAVDRAKRQSLVALYETPLVGPIATFIGPLLGFYDWGEAHLDYGSVCHLLDIQGFVPVVHAPPFLFWLKTACYVIVVSALPLVAVPIYGFYVCWQLLKRVMTGWAVEVDAPCLPFTLEDITKHYRAERPKCEAQLEKLKPNGGHPKMAHSRWFAETSTLAFLRRYSRLTRDIGGHPTRQSKSGADHHVCFPDLEVADHRRAQLREDFSNDVQVHKGQDCPHKSRLSMMSYVDFHMTRSELVKTIHAPTFIITHDFDAFRGTQEWYGGEATVRVDDNTVTMVTAGGTKYHHGYHRWGSEGVLVEGDGALHYRRMGQVDAHTIVIFVWPARGIFYRSDPTNLSSSGGLQQLIPVGDGVHAVIDRDKLGKLVFAFWRGGRSIGQVSHSCIIRAAHSLSSLKRGERFSATCDSVVRSRMVADEQDLSLLVPSTALSIKLADDMALLNGNLSVIQGDPFELGWFRRHVMLRFTRMSTWLPRSAQLVWVRFIVWVCGPSVNSTLVPWAWDRVNVPMYETSPKSETVDLVEDIHPAQPFPFGGQGDASGPASPDTDVPRTDANECESLPANKGVEPCAAAPSPSAPIPPPKVEKSSVDTPPPPPKASTPSDGSSPQGLQGACMQFCAGKHTGPVCQPRIPCTGNCKARDGTKLVFHRKSCPGTREKPVPTRKATHVRTAKPPAASSSKPPTNAKLAPPPKGGKKAQAKPDSRGAQRRVARGPPPPEPKSGAVPTGRSRKRTTRRKRTLGDCSGFTPAPPPAGAVPKVPEAGAQPLDAVLRPTAPQSSKLDALAKPFQPSTTTGFVVGESVCATGWPVAQGCLG